jgi:hypothetical protein
MSFRVFLENSAPGGPFRLVIRRNGEARAEAPVADQSYFEAVRSSPNRADLPIQLRMLPLRLRRQLQVSETVNRLKLSALSRYALDNYSPAFLALELIANHASPVWPRPATDSSGWNRLAEDAFDSWAERCGFDGVTAYAEFCRSLCYAIDLDGDVGVSAELEGGELRLRLWPSELIGGGVLNGLPPLENEWDGVLFDAAGRVAGYRVINDFTGEPLTYDRNQFLLLMEPDVPGRFRGLSALRRGLNDLRDAQETKTFVKLSAKIHSALTAVIENGALAESDWKDPEAPAVSSGETPKALTVAQLLGGEIPIIQGSLKPLTGASVGQNSMDYIAQLGGWFVAGLGLPPAYFLDERLTGPNQRSVIGKAQRRFDVRVRAMSRFAAWLWRRWAAVEIAAGRLPPMDGWDRVRFQTPPRATIDIGDVERSNREAYSLRLKSRKSYHEQTGDNWVDELSQCVSEDLETVERLRAAARAAGLPEDVMLRRYGFDVQPTPPKPPELQPAAPESTGENEGEAGAKLASGEVFAGRPDQKRDEHGRFAYEGADKKKKAKRRRKRKKPEEPPPSEKPASDATAKSEERAQRAKKSHKSNSPFKTALSGFAAQYVSKYVKGMAPTTLNKPYDAVSKDFGIEVKGLFENKNDKLTMHPPDFLDPVGSLNRKIIDSQKNPGRLILTVAFKSPVPDGPVEMAKRIKQDQMQWFVQVGVGSFRLNKMTALAKLSDLPGWLAANRERLQKATEEIRSRPIILWGGLRRGRELEHHLRQVAEWNDKIEKKLATKKDRLKWKNAVIADLIKRGRCVRRKDSLKPLYDWDGKKVRDA